MQQTRVHDRQAEIPANADVAVVEIVNPLGLLGEIKRNRRGEIVPPTAPKITAVRSLRGDVLAWLLARKTIDEEDFYVGLRWREIYEAAEIGSISSIDTTREAVDGGFMREVLTDHQADAMKALRYINAHMTVSETTLLQAIIGEGMTLSAVASAYGLAPNRYQIAALGDDFKLTLKKLAHVLEGVDVRPALG